MHFCRPTDHRAVILATVPKHSLEVQLRAPSMTSPRWKPFLAPVNLPFSPLPNLAFLNKTPVMIYSIFCFRHKRMHTWKTTSPHTSMCVEQYERDQSSHNIRELQLL